MTMVQNTTYPQYGPSFSDAMYKETLKGYGDQQAAYGANVSETMRGWNNLYNNQAAYGDSERFRVNQDAARQGAGMQQSMISRGLGNSTVLDSAARGVEYDRQHQMTSLNDQLLQRQNQIGQNALGYYGQAGMNAAQLQGQQLGWQGQVQQNTQAQDVQGALQGEGFNQQNYRAAQDFGYQQQAAQQGFQYQKSLAQQQYGNQRAIQSEFGYYGHGGYVHKPSAAAFKDRPSVAELTAREPRGYYAEGGTIPPPMGTDTVPARLTSGEFVLSKDMIHALESGYLDTNRLKQMIQQQRATSPEPGVQQFAHGGMVKPYGC